MEFGIKITGIEETCNLLQEAPKSVVPVALLHGLVDGGQVIEEFIAGSLAGELTQHTGDLLADLATTVVLDADSRGGIATSGFSGKQAHVARWDEYGHREIGHEPMLKPEGTELPHPFMRPAAEAAAEPAVAAFEYGVMEELIKGGIVDE